MKRNFASRMYKGAAAAMFLAVGLAAAQVSFAATDSATPSDYSETETKTETKTVPDGWYKEDGKWYYGEDGENVVDVWRDKDGKRCFLGENGYMLTNMVIEDGYDLYFVGRDGAIVKNMWVNVGGEYWMYLGENGVAFRNEKRKINGDYYLFDDDAKLLSGEVADMNGYYESIADNEDAILSAMYLCGKGENWEDCKATTGWYKYNGKLSVEGYDGYEEIWFFFNSDGKKIFGRTKTINGRERDFDENGILILGDVHINYYPAEGDTSHRVSEFYNSGAADCVYERPTLTILKEYPESEYKFLGWKDEDGKIHQVGDKIEFMKANVYGVWEALNKSSEIPKKSSGGGGGSDKGTTSTTTIYANGQSVTTTAQSTMSVGNDISGPYVSGRWKQTNGAWTFTDAEGKACVDGWAYVFNPHTTTPEKAAWFAFDENGNMRSGWFTDKDGRRYYLNPNANDPNFGVMQIGWVEIEGSWYYFNPKSDGTRGSMVTGDIIDGWVIGADGRRGARAVQ